MASYKFLQFGDPVFQKVSPEAREVLQEMLSWNLIGQGYPLALSMEEEGFTSIRVLQALEAGEKVDADVMEEHEEYMDNLLSPLDEIRKHVPGWTYTLQKVDHGHYMDYVIVCPPLFPSM